MELFIGKKFKVLLRGVVSDAEIIELDNNYAILLVNGIKFKISREKLSKKYSINRTENESIAYKKCKNCMEFKNGNCFGASKVCDEYRPSPEISKEEMSRWPKDGSASRLKSNTFIVREFDDFYTNYH